MEIWNFGFISRISKLWNVLTTLERGSIFKCKVPLVSRVRFDICWRSSNLLFEEGCLTLNLPIDEQTCSVLFFVSFRHSSFSRHRFDVLALVDLLAASPSPFRHSVSLSPHPCDTNDVTRAIPSDATPRYLHGRLFVPVCPPLYRFPFARLSR